MEYATPPGLKGDRRSLPRAFSERVFIQQAFPSNLELKIVSAEAERRGPPARRNALSLGISRNRSIFFEETTPCQPIRNPAS